MLRSLILILILLAACSEYPNITRVCVNYLEPDARCGTGFFVDHNKLITAKHIVSKSNSHVLTLVGPGPNETTSTYTYYNDLDVVLATTSTHIAESYFNICKKIYVGSEVDLVARRSRFGGLEIIPGTIISVYPDWLVIDTPVLPGYSGGPVIDVDRRCVIGSIMGVQQSTTTAAINLVTLLRASN